MATGETPTETGGGGWRQSRLLRRFLPLLIIVAIGAWLLRSTPSDTELVYDLGARREGLQTLRVRVVSLPEGELIRQADFRYGPGRPAPAEQPHSISLARGPYEIQATLDYDGNSISVRRGFEYEGEDRIWIRL